MMVRKVFICMICLFLFGCTHDQSIENQNFDTYNEIKEKLLSQENYDKSYDFQIDLIYNLIDTNYRYDIIINQPKNEMYHIIAMSYASETDNEMCPNIGIFDVESFHLKKDYIDKKSGFYKGIQLSGTTEKKQPIKVYICYYTDINKEHKVEKYIEVNEK